MNEEEARRLLLVRAVESVDAAEAVLTREDRQQATGAALDQWPSKEGGRSPDRRKADEAFLVRRSDFAFARVATRFPAAAQACRRLQWPSWLDWVLPAGALALGVATNELDNGQRLNIIAFPLMGMLAWNLAVYALLLVRALRGLAPGPETSPSSSHLAGVLGRMATSARPPGGGDPTLGRALARFTRDWLHYSSELTYSRASRTLHLAAAALAAGVLLGMYVRALGVEYRAGWESTFIGAGTLQGLLRLVLGPASALTGIHLPGPEQLEAMRWTSGARGVNAGPWIHLYAATASIFVIGPRLLLGAWNGFRAFRLRRRFPAPGTEDFYVRRLLRSARGEGGVVRVIPYSFNPPEPTRRRLERSLTDILGDGTRMTMDTPIPYGGEDEWLTQADFSRDADHLVVLFNLSATPEAENQGALVAGIRRRLAQGRNGVGLTVLVDESSYRQRLAGQAGAEDRLRTRRLAWDATLSREGVKPTPVDLGDAEADALTRRLEGALMKGPELIGGGGAA